MRYALLNTTDFKNIMPHAAFTSNSFFRNKSIDGPGPPLAATGEVVRTSLLLNSIRFSLGVRVFRGL